MSAVAEDTRALSADEFLAHAGELGEETVTVPGVGPVLCRELDGVKRALVLSVLAPAASGGTIDFARYQELLLQHGLADPSSPAAARQPLLDMAGAKKAMQLGGSKVELLCKTVERLSGLDAGAQARAEGNSADSPSSSTSSE